MTGLTEKTLETSRGFTYTYYVRHAGPHRPALLLQHGFPDDHELWGKIMPDLLELPYTIIVPDLLGYGGTSKPADPQAYNSKGMCQDLIDILDQEKVKHFISVGHDWGCYLASRMILWHRERALGLMLLNIYYRHPAPADIQKTNERLTEMTGLPRMTYQEFFTSPGAVELMESQLESVYCVLHGNDEGTHNFMEDIMCHPGVLKDYLETDKRQPLKEYAKDPKFKNAFMQRFKRDGFTGPLNWYHASIGNMHWQVEKEIPHERHVLDLPVLFIGATKDPVGLTRFIHIPKEAGHLPDLTIEEVDSGHWQLYEAPDKTGPIMRAWLKKRQGDFKPKM